MLPRWTDAGATPLEVLPLRGEHVLDGTPHAGIVTLGDFAGLEVGTWELTEGTVHDTEVDEVFVVVKGRGTLTFADGEVIELHPGVIVHLNDGEQTTWTVTEPLRKVWLVL
ncbi:MAG: cupin domain-containing protein [Nocardioidaceae bacterium]|nr:cupin domain-containing protein [Nocardioidaceae bacterium]MCL2613861.1 cupin domain-containing protein [Nocardioidaceae bacterium]